MLTVATAALAAVAIIALILVDHFGTYPARVTEYTRTPDTYHIVVYVGLGVGDPIVGQDVREEADKITVTVRARRRTDMGDFKSSFAIYAPVTITLHDPIGSRQVLDDSGRTVPETK